MPNSQLRGKVTAMIWERVDDPCSDLNTFYALYFILYFITFRFITLNFTTHIL